jgi:hypothetical protein
MMSAFSRAMGRLEKETDNRIGEASPAISIGRADLRRLLHMLDCRENCTIVIPGNSRPCARYFCTDCEWSVCGEGFACARVHSCNARFSRINFVWCIRKCTNERAFALLSQRNFARMRMQDLFCWCIRIHTREPNEP